MHDECDSVILQYFVTDRKQAIQLLFERYYRPLVLYASSIIDDDNMAEDIVQDFFVKLWKEDYLLQIQPKALSSYLFTSIRNSCLTYSNKKDVLRSGVDYSKVDVIADVAININEDIIIRVTSVIKKLPEQTHEIVERVLLKDMKYQEVADELGISINTVKTLLRKGLHKIREELKDDRALFLFFCLNSIKNIF